MSKTDGLIVLLFLVAVAVGCFMIQNHKPKSQFVSAEWACDCRNILKGSYKPPHYWFECIDCGRIFADKQYVNVDGYYDAVRLRVDG